MKRFLCKKKLVKDHVVELDSDFYHHAIRVLKIKTNESIVLFNENGKEFYCKIQKILNFDTKVFLIFSYSILIFDLGNINFVP